MTNNKKDLNAPFQHENHTLKTRRDFLSQGLLAGLSYTMIPSLLSMIHSNAANALECGLGQQTAVNRVPVLIFDLSGGANFVGSNVMVGKAGGQLDFIANYEDRKPPVKLSLSTFKRGLNELEEAQIIAKHMRPGWYFINPNFAFNGDRIAFTTIIEKNGTTKKEEQQELPLDAPDEINEN